MARRPVAWQIGVGTTPAPFNAVGTDDDVAAWVAQVVTNGGTVSPGRASLISTMVAAWKAAGTWLLIDDAWLLVAENVPQALTSIKQRRLAASVAAPAFTADRGYAFSGSAYIDTLFVPATHKVAMTGTNMHIAVYERTNAAIGAGAVAAGCQTTSSAGLSLSPRTSTNFLQTILNSQLIGPSGDTVSDSRGLSVGSRNGTLAADVLAYKNGVAILPFAPGTLSSALPTIKVYIGARSDASNVAVGFRAATEGFVSVGAAIPAAKQPGFYAALQSFMTAVGANV